MEAVVLVHGNDRFDLERFVIAQKTIYRKVLSELNNGRKESHWMWFIFLKFKSSMTLFSRVSAPDPVFDRALEKYFDGEHDRKTLELLYCVR